MIFKNCHRDENNYDRVQREDDGIGNIPQSHQSQRGRTHQCHGERTQDAMHPVRRAPTAAVPPRRIAERR